MMKSVISISIAVLASMSIAAHGQSNAVETPVVGAPVHPGTAILDSMNIFAGVPTPIGAPVHPRTVQSSPASIVAGKPVAVPVVDVDIQGPASAVPLK